MRRIKRMIFKHFNCIPWFIVGIQILVDGESVAGSMRCAGSAPW